MLPLILTLCPEVQLLGAVIEGLIVGAVIDTKVNDVPQLKKSALTYAAPYWYLFDVL